MREDIAGPQGASSRPMWETLEGMLREKAQEFIQQIMEEEVTELLGRRGQSAGVRWTRPRATATDMASRGGLSAHGPVRAPTPADGRLGGLPSRRDSITRGRAEPPITH